MRPALPMALVAGTVALVATGLVLAAPAQAQERGSRMTRDYVAAAGQSDAFETLEAQTALVQSQDPQVRGYAQMMVQDHARTTQTLTDATQKAGLMPPPNGVGADQAPLLGALQGLRGADFDKAYWRHQVIGHTAALVTTQNYAAKGDNAAVRDAARGALPIIQAHLQQAQRMAGMAGG